MPNPERTRAAMPSPLNGLVNLSPAIGGLGFRDCCGKALASNPILLSPHAAAGMVLGCLVAPQKQGEMR